MAVILCVIALFRVRRSGQKGRGLAIAGLVISVLWVVLFAGLIALNAVNEADRDEFGSVTQDGRADVQDVSPGDCLREMPSGATFRVHLVPCDQPHEAQAVTAFELQPGPYPGEDAVIELAENGCEDRLDAAGLTERIVVEGDISFNFFYPTRQSWNRDRQVVCVLKGEPGPLTETFPVI